jgi:hypothetical protein
MTVSTAGAAHALPRLGGGRRVRALGIISCNGEDFETRSRQRSRRRCSDVRGPPIPLGPTRLVFARSIVRTAWSASRATARPTSARSCPAAARQRELPTPTRSPERRQTQGPTSHERAPRRPPRGPSVQRGLFRCLRTSAGLSRACDRRRLEGAGSGAPSPAEPEREEQRDHADIQRGDAGDHPAQVGQ